MERDGIFMDPCKHNIYMYKYIFLTRQNLGPDKSRNIKASVFDIQGFVVKYKSPLHHYEA